MVNGDEFDKLIQVWYNRVKGRNLYRWRIKKVKKTLKVLTSIFNMATYVVNFSSTQHADEAIDILNARNDINFAEPNYYISFEQEVQYE